MRHERAREGGGGGGHDRRPAQPPDYDSLSIEELARLQGVKPAQSVEDMACPGLFESDEELDDFIAHTYAARRRDMA